MTPDRYSGERAYDADIAASYEEDRRTEKIWGLEQAYMMRAAQGMTSGASLLDIPVGTGRFLHYYERRKLQVLGVDISDSMLAQARAKATSSNVRLALGDARSLQLGSGSFDYVVCWRLLHLLPPHALPAVVGELSRVARGTLYFQGYVHDRLHKLLALKARCERVLMKLTHRTPPSGARWSHIQSYAHDEAMLLGVFSGCGLSVGAIDVLGSYGSMRVKVYVLRKV